MPAIIHTAGLNSLIDVGAFEAFQTALTMSEPEDIGREIATIVPINRAEARLPFLWYPPRMREWVGERLRGALQGEMLSIPVRTYEASVAVPRTVVEDQMVRLIEIAVSNMAREYNRYLHEQVVNVLLNGTTLTAFDGQPLLSPSARGADNANVVTNVQLTMDALQAGIAAMGLYTDPVEGRPLGITPTHLVVGKRNEWLARELTESPTIIIRGSTDSVRGSMNAISGLLQVIATPYIKNQSWFLVAAGSNPFRPVVRVDRSDVPLEFAARTTPEADSVFERDSYEYGIRARHGFAPGAWYTVYASVFA